MKPTNVFFLFTISFSILASSAEVQGPGDEAAKRTTAPQTAARARKKAISGKPASAKVGKKEPAPEGAVKIIRTTHLLTLTNGQKIRCNFVEEKGNTVVFALRPYGSFAVPKERIASLRKDAGEITLKSAPPKKEVSPRPPQKKKTAGVKEEPSIEEKLTPPPVPLEKEPDINYWLYQLTRQDHKWRVRAETHLKAMGEIVVGPLIPYTRWRHWIVRAAALRILAAVKHPSVVPHLFEALGDPEPIVREVAARSLRKVTGRRIPFDPRGTPGILRRGIKRWETYLRKAGLILPPEPEKGSS